MADTNTTVAENAAPASAPAPKGKSKEKKQRQRKIRNGIIAVVVIAALAVGAWFLYRFLNQTEEVNNELQTTVANFGSIQSSVQGSGSARAKESAAITLTQSGTVQELYVTAGDMVTAGQPLYTIYSQAAEEAAATAREAVETVQSDLNDLYSKFEKLTVRAPFAGKLIRVNEFTQGLKVSEGAEVCTLVNDKQLKLTLYFSYTYDGAISVGQSVNVSIPAVMSSYQGRVETIHKVHYITPEGGDHFEVVVVFDNPGTLTKDMDASAVMTAADGSPIYPYENGKTEYYEERQVVAEVAGPMVSVNMLRYADVQAGDALLVLGAGDLQDQIREKEKDLETKQEALTKAEEALQDFDAVAPIDGTVTSCTLSEGAEVHSGDTVITISNNTTMIVSISVDDRNIAYVKPGMGVDLMSNWGDGSSFYGVVTKIDMSLSGDAMGSGMTNYPVTLEVDNYDGSLLEGMWLSYSFVTSQSDDCITVPMQSVKYVSLEDGETASVIFIQSDTKPENAVELDLPELMPGETPTYPSEEDGFYAVPVTTGLNDLYNVEIKEGLQGGETVFVNYFVSQAWG